MTRRRADWESTYSSHTLHAKDECVLRQVSRVGHGVLLPQLAEQRVQGREVGLVEGIVALEEEVDGSACSVVSPVCLYSNTEIDTHSEQTT